MKHFLETFAAIVGVATVTVLLMSAVHEFGYFLMVGTFFQTLLTPSDYFSNMLIWVTTIPLFAIPWFRWDILSEKSRLQRLGMNRNGAMFLLLVCILLGTFLFGPHWLLWFAALPGLTLWLIYGPDIVPFKNTRSKSLYQLRLTLFSAPVVLSLLFVWGIFDGQRDLKRLTDVYTIQTRRDGKIQRILMRNFDKGLLVRDAVANKVEFIKWDDVSGISHAGVDFSTWHPLSCSLFGLFCPTGPPPL